MPILRRKRTFRAVVDYKEKMDEEIKSLWAARAQLGLHGGDCIAAEHSAEYMEWYGQNTTMFIGRGEETKQPMADEQAATQAKGSSKQDEPTIPQKHVQLILFYNISDYAFHIVLYL